MPAGIGSDTTVPGAATLPTFDAVTVYVTVPPGASAPGSLEVLVTLTCGDGGLLTDVPHGGGVLPGRHDPPGGVIVTVFVTTAGGFALTVATIV